MCTARMLKNLLIKLLRRHQCHYFFNAFVKTDNNNNNNNSKKIIFIYFFLRRPCITTHTKTYTFLENFLGPRFYPIISIRVLYSKAWKNKIILFIPNCNRIYIYYILQWRVAFECRMNDLAWTFWFINENFLTVSLVCRRTI